MTDEGPQPGDHKPKPARHWRGYLREYAIIVVGVATALAAQQVADWLRWRSEVGLAKDVIATELTSNLVGAIARARTRNCTERRLDTLSLILDAAAQKGALPPVGGVGVPPRALWPSGAWESVVASQTATHFPRQMLADMAGAYKLTQRLEEFSGHEVLSWKAVHTMIGPGRRFDPPSEAVLRQALSSARIDNRVMTNQSTQLIEAVGRLHLRLGPEDQERLATARNQPLSEFSVCRLIGAVANSYGQAYSANMPEARIEAALKSLSTYSQARDE